MQGNGSNNMTDYKNPDFVAIRCCEQKITPYIFMYMLRRIFLFAPCLA
jgi:hypothetical protein